MSYFAVIREAGPAWADGIGIAGQPALAEHAAFMKTLADEGFVLCGGPLAGTEHERLRALLIVRAGSEAEIRRRLANDPWTRADRLVISSIESLKIMTGTERLPPTSAPRASGDAAALSSAN
ncbi:MAG: YciI family protein [Solirubrobacteraceae bacterium]